MVGKVIGGALRLRSMASTSGAIVYSIPDGSTVEVDLCSNQQWFRAVYSGYSGYVMSQYIHVTGGGTNATITTSSDPLNIRALPSTSSSILFTASKGMAVKVLESSSGFYRISCSLGTGWGSSQYITLGGGGSTTTVGNHSNTGDWIQISATSVRVRSTAQTGNTLGYVNSPDKYKVQGKTSALNSDDGKTYAWYKIQAPCGLGWIRGDLCIHTSEGGGTPSNPYVSGSFIKIANATSASPLVNVRPTASSSGSYIGRLRNGTLAICDGTGTSNGQTWVKILWGGEDSSRLFGYILSDFAQPTNTYPQNKKDAAIRIGLSMVDAGYTDPAHLGIAANEWCVKFLSYLMKAAGVSSFNYPASNIAKVSDAETFFSDSFGLLSRGRMPSIGDWIFYQTDSEIHQHVGLVTAVNGSLISTVEGNMSNTIKKYENQNFNGTIHNMTVRGFATPNWV